MDKAESSVVSSSVLQMILAIWEMILLLIYFPSATQAQSLTKHGPCPLLWSGTKMQHQGNLGLQKGRKEAERKVEGGIFGAGHRITLPFVSLTS
jgi:hypothetical protein